MLRIKNRLYYWRIKLKLLYLTWFYKKSIKIGKGCRVDFNSRLWIIGKDSEIVLGDNCYIRSREFGYHVGMPFPCTLYAVGGGKIDIGNGCRLNGVFINSEKSIKIGDNCVIASGVQMMDSNGHVVHSLNRTIGRDNPKEIVIGNNCWIGLNSIVLKGTTLGNNCVVGAGSVVSGLFPDNVIVKGNPAQIVGEVKV